MTTNNLHDHRVTKHSGSFYHIVDRVERLPIEVSLRTCGQTTTT